MDRLNSFGEYRTTFLVSGDNEVHYELCGFINYVHKTRPYRGLLCFFSCQQAVKNKLVSLTRFATKIKWGVYHKIDKVKNTVNVIAKITLKCDKYV